MRISGQNLIAVLEQKSQDETLICAVKRIFPEKFTPPSALDWAEAKKETETYRIRKASDKAAIKMVFKEDRLLGMCLACWTKICRITFSEWGRYCSICGARDNLTCHHIVPRAEHGPTDTWNLMPLCSPCHDYVEQCERQPRTREDCIRVGLDRLK